MKKKPLNLTFVNFKFHPNAKEFRELTDQTSFLLRPSPLGGVGVFASHNIEQGVRLLMFPTGGRFISNKTIETSPEWKPFAEFYGVKHEAGYVIPKKLNSMDVGWFLNHKENCNARHDEWYRYYAKRRIKAGEEITINYELL